MSSRVPFGLVLTACAVASVLLIPTERVFAQSVCPGCPDPCMGFVSESCSTASGCAGKTFCDRGLRVCDTTGYQLPCPACGEGGFAVCSPRGVPGACRPAVPSSTEQCNGCDDNADGVVDNAPGSKVPGSVVELCQGPGICSGSKRQCTQAGWDVCKVPEEICNGLDDDCDQSVDEGDVCLQACTP